MKAYASNKEATTLIKDMKAELESRKKYVFLIIRHSLSEKHQCYWFTKERLSEIKPWLKQIKALGWEADKNCIIISDSKTDFNSDTKSRKRSRSSTDGYESRAKKMKEIPLHEIMVE
jgi:hypothetical protein